MDVLDADREEGCFTFIWTIENYNFCFLEGEDIEYNSPTFELDEDSCENWCFLLSPERYFRHDIIKLALQREVNSKRREITLELSICDFNGLYKKVPSETYMFELTDCYSEYLYLTLDKEVLKTYPNNHSITVKCRIWQTGTEVLETRQCYARTIIGVEKMLHSGTLENFEEFEKDLKIDKSMKIVSKCPFFNVNFFSTGGTYADKKVEIKIKPITPNTELYSTCEICLIDADGEIAYSVRDEYNYETSSPEQVWTFPFIHISKVLRNKKLYLPNGILHLRCEFVVSSGVQYNRIERTECGMVNNHLLQCRGRTAESDLAGSLKENLQRFFLEGKFSDVTIKAASKDFQVHKTILCARSEVFSAMFERDMKENQTGIVEIEDIDDDTVSKMLLFLYTDTVGEDLEFGTASILYFAADKYEIVALKKKCSDFLKDNFTLTTVCDVLVLADMHQDQELKSAAQKFIFEHSKELMDSEEWKELMKKQIQLASEIMHEMLKKLQIP